MIKKVIIVSTLSVMISFLTVGCGKNSGTISTPKSNTQHELGKDVVLQAKKLARSEGYDLKNYSEPEAKFNSDDNRWEVSFEYKDPAPPGCDCEVWIYQSTCKVQLMKGEYFGP